MAIFKTISNLGGNKSIKANSNIQIQQNELSFGNKNSFGSNEKTFHTKEFLASVGGAFGFVGLAALFLL
ncbi:hypothetical protein RB653_000547 [Dictyostelium firmibasis]|uniref:Uncharacterized protein n=1 Tax=Dictyostelium firmibasis TaxID=79012 RepID=A0AAN7U2G7_9MYCE